MIYINSLYDGIKETVDEAKNQREAKEIIRRYREDDPEAEYWTSSKPCDNWNSLRYTDHE